MEFLTEYKKEIIGVGAFVLTFAMLFLHWPFFYAPSLAANVWLTFGKFEK